MALLGIAGAGAWGTALAVVAARAGHAARLWARDPAHVSRLRQDRENRRHLPGVMLPEAVAAIDDIAALANVDALLLVVPAQQVRAVCRALPPASAPLVVCAKGLEQATGLRLSQVVAEERPGQPLAVLSGPSFALEVGQGLPTAVTVAAGELALAAELAELLASTTFRPYPSDDLLGVELAGALKNVIAIAAGITMGRKLGENARASLVTRGLAEMARLAEALGARRETLMGLSGLGDLMLTATSLTSRNTSFGHELAHGRSPEELLGEGGKLSEGAFTAEAACILARQTGVELPVAEAVRRVVAGEIGVDHAIQSLLARPLAPME